MNPYQCEDCGAPVDETDRVDALMVHPDACAFERIGRYCAACAEVFASQRTYGEVDEHCMRTASEMMGREYPASMAIRWVQGDWFKFLILVRRDGPRPCSNGRDIPTIQWTFRCQRVPRR